MLERSLCVLATLVVGTTATAQYWRTCPFSPLIDPAPAATDTVAGNFTGYNCPDFAFRVGTQIVLCTAPSIHNATTPVADRPDANGLATIPGGGDSGRDALAIATGSGLVEWKRDATSCTIIDASVDWRTVVCGDLDGNSPADFVGVVGSARDRLRFVIRNGSSVTCSETVFTGQTIASVVLAQWNDTGPLEACAATEQRLWVGTSTTTLRQLVLANDGNSCLTRVHMDARDNLAWFVRVASEPRLYGVSRLGQTMAVTTGLGSPTHIAAGDIDGNLADDLLLTGPNTLPKLVMNASLPTANVASFDLTSVTSMTPFTSVQPTNHTFGAAWFGDIDSDLRADLFLPWKMTNGSNVTSGSVWLYMNAYGLEPRPRLLPEVETGGSSTEHTFTLTVDSEFPPPIGATHVEMFVFAARAVNGVIALVPEGLLRHRTPLPLVNGEVSFSVPIVPDMPRAFGIALRWIDLDGTSVEQVWTSTLLAFAMDGDVLPYTTWRDARVLEAVPLGMLWTPTTPQTIPYFLQPLLLAPGPGGGIYTSHSGDEEPPDLPPPPPVPPKPPTPPPPTP